MITENTLKVTDFENRDRVDYPIFNSRHDDGVSSSELLFIDSVFEVLRKVEKPIIFLCRGTSMSMFAGALVYLLRKESKLCSIEIFRKEGENCHYNGHYRGQLTKINEGNYYCIIDDLIASGDSVVSILKKVESPKLDALFVSSMMTTIDSENQEIIRGSFDNIYCGLK